MDGNWENGGRLVGARESRREIIREKEREHSPTTKGALATYFILSFVLPADVLSLKRMEDFLALFCLRL